MNRDEASAVEAVAAAGVVAVTAGGRECAYMATCDGYVCEAVTVGEVDGACDKNLTSCTRV